MRFLRALTGRQRLSFAKRNAPDGRYRHLCCGRGLYAPTLLDDGRYGSGATHARYALANIWDGNRETFPRSNEEHCAGYVAALPTC
jgi:hypothetical protein